MNFEGKIKCLECGKFYIKPMSHVWQKHQMSAREYKEQHGLDLKKGIIPESHRELLREHALDNKMDEQLKRTGVKTRFTSGHKVNYVRSEQTMARLKTHFLEVAKRTGREPVEKIEIKCAGCGTPKMIYPRALREGNNFCGMRCRNISNNKKRYESIHAN